MLQAPIILDDGDPHHLAAPANDGPRAQPSAWRNLTVWRLSGNLAVMAPRKRRVRAVGARSAAGV